MTPIAPGIDIDSSVRYIIKVFFSIAKQPFTGWNITAFTATLFILIPTISLYHLGSFEYTLSSSLSFSMPFLISYHYFCLIVSFPVKSQFLSPLAWPQQSWQPLWAEQQQVRIETPEKEGGVQVRASSSSVVAYYFFVIFSLHRRIFFFSFPTTFYSSSVTQCLLISIWTTTLALRVSYSWTFFFYPIRWFLRTDEPNLTLFSLARTFNTYC